MKVGENGSLRPSLKSSNCVFCSLTFAIERPKKGERTHNVCRVQGSKIKKNEKEKKRGELFVCGHLPFLLSSIETKLSSHPKVDHELHMPKDVLTHKKASLIQKHSYPMTALFDRIFLFFFFFFLFPI